MKLLKSTSSKPNERESVPLCMNQFQLQAGSRWCKIEVVVVTIVMTIVTNNCHVVTDYSDSRTVGNTSTGILACTECSSK